MKCKICDSSDLIKVLDKPENLIWTGGPDSSRPKKRFPAVLWQCTSCSHVQQFVSDEFIDELEIIYASEHAHASTPLGESNWAIQRASVFLEFLNIPDNYSSAVELGCSNIYILSLLKEKGFKKLTGICPSVDESLQTDDIKLMKEYVSKDTKLNEKTDLILSYGVFEHIDKIKDIIEFSFNNLNENGTLYFAVPDAEFELNNNYASLFVHEHYHYYTKKSLTTLLSKYGFFIEKIVSKFGAFHVSAKKTSNALKEIEAIDSVIYEDYDKNINYLLQRVEEFIKPNTIVHGCNNGLNNVLGWQKINESFTLVDNDEAKHGKTYFKAKVHSFEEINLKDYDRLFIVPPAFDKEIMQQYIDNGFSGEISSFSIIMSELTKK